MVVPNTFATCFQNQTLSLPNLSLPYLSENHYMKNTAPPTQRREEKATPPKRRKQHDTRKDGTTSSITAAPRKREPPHHFTLCGLCFSPVFFEEKSCLPFLFLFSGGAFLLLLLRVVVVLSLPHLLSFGNFHNEFL